MKILKYLIFLVSLFFGACLFTACHLDKKPESPKGPQSPSTPAPNTTSGNGAVPEEKPIKLLWTGSLDFTNHAKYRDILRDSLKCDACSYNQGFYSCENFDSKADVTIQFEKQELPAEATLSIKPYYFEESSILNLNIWAGGCGVYNQHTVLMPITVKGTARHWSDYEGFYVRFSGATNLGSIIVRSDSSTPEVNGILNVKIYYGSTNQNSEVGVAKLDNSDLEDPYEGSRDVR